MDNKSSHENYINPPDLHQTPAFSNPAIINKPDKVICIGNQNAMDENGTIIGLGDMELQAQQILKNIGSELQKNGAKVTDIFKWTVYVLEDEDPGPAFNVFHDLLKRVSHPPLVTIVYVTKLSHSSFLLEVEAVAAIY